MHGIPLLRRILVTTACIVLAGLVGTVAVAAPAVINYQGRVTNADGEPITGTIVVTFTIYDAASGGTSYWSETHPSIAVSDGLFSVGLGTITPILDSVFNGDRYLGVQIDSDPEIAPRQQLTSVPWAHRVMSINGALGGLITGDVAILGRGNIGTANALAGTGAFVAGGSNIVSGDYAAGLGHLNQVLSNGASVGGGGYNRATGHYATVSGGGGTAPNKGNVASGQTSAIAGGQGNEASGGSSFVGGGDSNTADGIGATIGGGFENTSSGLYSTVGGGFQNEASDSSSVVGGGYINLATGYYNFIGGGIGNITGGRGSVICGGGLHPDGNLDNPGEGANFAAGEYCFIGGGADNYIAGEFYQVIAGGERHYMDGEGSFIGGGKQNSIYESDIHRPFYSVICGGVRNKTVGSYSFLGSGLDNDLWGSGSAIVTGGYLTQENMGMHRWVFINQIDTSATYSFIGTGWGNRASDSCSLVLGGVHNYARGKFSVVVGGGADFDPFIDGTVVPVDSNLAGGDYGVILGGRGHVANGFASAIGGGSYNRAYGDFAVISGGGGANVSDSNSASGVGSAVGGGAANAASGTYATVPGGFNCEAAGKYSVAMGHNANADYDGSFVWSDDSRFAFASKGINEFRVRASGGTYIFSNEAASSGVQLAAGSGSWSSISDSTQKRNVRAADAEGILAKVAQLQVSRWNYRDQADSIEHIGPMAQDFYRLFAVGEDDRHISTIDIAGVTLAAIQALEEKSRQVDELTRRVEQLERLLLERQ